MYIDTSCLVAYYLPEENSSMVQDVIRSVDEVYVSSVTDLEILSAIRKKQRLNEINTEEADLAYGLYREHRKEGIYLLSELSQEVFKSSELILQTTSFPLRTLDAIHLGTAYEYKLKLFIFDRVLMDSAKEFKIKTVQ